MPTAEEARKPIAAAEGTRLHLLIMFWRCLAASVAGKCAQSSGSGSISIGERRTISESPQVNATFAPRETKRSRLTIALPASALAALRVHKAKQNVERLKKGEFYSDLGPVFACALGERGSRRRSQSSSRLLPSARASATFGPRPSLLGRSLLIERGVPATAVSEMLGHADAAITLFIYAHSIKGAEERAARTMESLLKGTESGW